MRYREILEATDIELHPKELKQFGNRYRLTRAKNGSQLHDLDIHPDDGHLAATYIPRRRKSHKIAYYDPELSDLTTNDQDDDILNYTFAKPKAHLSTTIEPLAEPNLIYRGMSFEEYQRFLQTGFVQSTGSMNFSGQEGLTYWSTDPSAAISYANAYAPMQFKPTFSRPAYVVAARCPTKTIHVPGTATHEVGVPGPINKDQVVAVWQGKVFQFTPGDFLIRPSNNYDDDYYYLSGGSNPSAHVVWHRLAKLDEHEAPTIVSASTAKHGGINRKTANKMVDPKGYFQKNKDKNFNDKGSFYED